MTTQVLAPSTRISSGVPRRSKFQNDLGRVHVSVVASCTVGTRPLPNRERHFLLIAPAVATGFTGRGPAIHNNDLAPSPGGFVFDLAAKNVITQGNLHVNTFLVENFFFPPLAK